MTEVVVRAEGLGKKYLIGHQSAERERYTALRDVIGRSLNGLGRSAIDMVRGRQIVAGDEVEEFWALKDCSFAIKRGEVIGIIGRNGAGKSTLLKILSRITEPSTGRVEIKGRVASLLEVGTGFHPELTGRENIYLNAAILGMKRSEVRKNFDEIVAFADVEKFLDTPVKRFSSGMYVRLAFAVAAHLAPEILIVDEVLAVGDAEFQRKCLGKMQDVAGHGRTVIVVAHNMAMIRLLCSRAILLQNGQIALSGSTDVAIQEYARLSHSTVAIPISERKDRGGTGDARLQNVLLLDANGIIAKEAFTGGAYILCVTLCNRTGVPLQLGNIAIVIKNDQEQRLSLINSSVFDINSTLSPGNNIFRVRIPKFPLTQGRYRLDFWINGAHVNFDSLLDAVEIPVCAGDFFGTGKISPTAQEVLFEHRFLSECSGSGVPEKGHYADPRQ